MRPLRRNPTVVISLYGTGLFCLYLDTRFSQSIRRCFQRNGTGLLLRFNDRYQFTVEKVHPRQMEKIETRRITIGAGTVAARPFHVEADQLVYIGTGIAVFIYY